ncbi:MAG: ACT domain-containing protein [Myxococcales bacterium]|nr:ACT domain-containing protein [Myxococcales bacterium]
MVDEERLAEVRKALEAADSALAAALDARAQATKDLAALAAAIPDRYQPLRAEEAIVQRARGLVRAFPREPTERIFREVISACEALVAPRRVVYDGVEGGFAHLAARRRFGGSAELRSVDGPEVARDEVARGRADFALVPFETSNDGAVTATLNALSEGEVKVCSEVTVVASYELMSSGVAAAGVEKIYGEPAAVAACERFLRTRYPHAMVLDAPSGEVAARFCAVEPGAAVVGTDLLRDAHGLTVVHAHIEDAPGASVRFAVLGTALPSRTGADRTVLAVATPDEPGALYRVLQPFAERHVNLTRLESRPARDKPWPYLFFIELDGHTTDRAVLLALESLRTMARFVKVLGSYPRPT